MAADLKDLFPNWWSREWAKVKLWDFTPKMLGDGFRLLSEGCFSHVSADGKGPFYCISEQLRVKLRFLRFTPKQKTEIRDIILHDEAGCEDLQRGIMNRPLWNRLRRSGLSPELSGDDELSNYSGVPARKDRAYHAAALLLASWLVNSDPALMFAWRGLSLYDELSLPQRPLKPLPDGRMPAGAIELPAARNERIAERESDVLTRDSSGIIERWAPEAHARSWLLNRLPPQADLSEAERIAPKLHGFITGDLQFGRGLTASLDLPDGKSRTVAIAFHQLPSTAQGKFETYFRGHRDECLSIGQNVLTPEISGSIERLWPGFFEGRKDELRGERGDPALLALALRTAAAVSRYPRLMFILRGFRINGWIEYHRNAADEAPKPRRRRSRRRFWDDDYMPYHFDSWDDDSDDEDDEPADLSPENPDGREPDAPGGARWVRRWLRGTGFDENSSAGAGGKIILREGRAGDFVLDKEKHLLSTGITDEFGDVSTVTLAFKQYGSRERDLISAMLHLHPERLDELRKGVVSGALQTLFGKYNLDLIPDGNEDINVTKPGTNTPDVCAMLIKATQLLSDNPVLLLKCRGFDIDDGSSLDPRNLSADALLEVCAPGEEARGFMSLFIPDPLKAPLLEAAVLLSGGSIGEPAAEHGTVRVDTGSGDGRKSVILTMRPFTCAEAADLTETFDSSYSLLRSLARGGSMHPGLRSMLEEKHALPAGGTLTMDGTDVTDRVMSDPLLTAVIIRLAEAAGRRPVLLFAWRGLPLGLATLGEIRAELQGKSPEEPFLMEMPEKTDYYFERTLSSCLSDPRGSFRWWGNEWLDSLSDSCWDKKGVRAEAERMLGSGGMGELRFLPNQRTLCCSMKGKSGGLKRLTLPLDDLNDREREQILVFFRDRPGLTKALRLGYLDRSFMRFAKDRSISLICRRYGEYLKCGDDDVVRNEERCAFVLQQARLLDKDPSLMFIWRGLDIWKELGLGAGAPLQEPDGEQLREYDEADAAKSRGKGAPEEGGADDFLRRSFARRLIANLADDAITGWQRDAAASRISEPEFRSEEHSAGIIVRHGRGSPDRASLCLEPLSGEQQKMVTGELREDQHALMQLQVGRLDEEFLRRLQSLGVPLMCGESTGDRLKCTCEVSEYRVCRHEIALLKRTAQRVSADPALLFLMRGLDLKAELKKLGIEKGTAPSWMSHASLLQIHPELDAKDAGDMLPEDALYHLNRASFAKVPSGLIRSAMRLLAESPAGYGGSDCRGAVLSALDAARECAAAMAGSETEIVSLPDFSRCRAEIGEDGRPAEKGRTRAQSVFRITPDDRDPLSRKYLADALHVSENHFDRISPEKADTLYSGSAWPEHEGIFSFEEMHSLPSGIFNGKIAAEVLDRAGTETQAMYALCSLARKLVTAGAVMPCPLRPDGGNIYVMWIPCLLAHEVLTLTAHAGMLARRLLLGSVIVPGKKSGLRAEDMSDAGFGAYCLGLFITDLVRKGAMKSIGSAQSAWNRTASETPELLLMTLSFWPAAEISPAVLGRMESSVGQWLAPLFIGLNGMRPVLILGTSAGPEPDIASAEERLRAGGEQAIADAEKAEDEEAKGREEDLGGASVEEQVSAEITLGFIDREDGRYVSYSEVSWLDAGKRGECRAAAARISALLPEAADIISGKSGRAVLSIEALQKALFEILPALKLSGALVVLPRSMRRILRPAAMANLALMKGWKGGSGLMSLTSLLSFNWKATLGGREITEEQFEELREHAGHLVRFGNDYVYASASEIDSILRRLSGKAQRPSRLRLLEAALSGSFEGNEVFMDEKIRKAINEELKTPPAKVPDGLKAELRPYQERGYSWLMHNLRARMGSIIADDMGLGKTVQVIAALESLRSSGELDKDPALVTVPASVVINWTRELRRFAPGLTVNVYYGTQRSLEPKANVLLTTYGTLRQDIEKLKDKKWRVAVADEAQNIKNPGSQIFQDMCIIRADSAIAMSGTPVENRLADYWAIMEFVNPGLFGTLGTFVTEYAQPIERSRDADAVRRLRGVTAPFILRRLKTDKSVIADLPDKISSDRFCALTPEQAAMYQTFVSDGLAGVTETLTKLERSARVLKLILRLKQICDAPELFSKDPKITGPEHSGKAEMLLDLLEELTGNGQKAIVFTQFREMGDLLVSWIGERLGTVPDFIHGGVGVKKRQEMVDRFQNDPQDRVMVLSLKAAGTGLNLTAATAVIHYDLWWNPAVEDQATDRAYRIGQNKNVMVYRFICAGTFEEKINEIINSKKEIAELTVQKGEKWLGDLSKSELRSFLAMSAG